MTEHTKPQEHTKSQEHTKPQEPAKPETDVPSTAGKVDDLIFICEHLSALLDKENLALIEKRRDAIGEFLEEKRLLCDAYASRGKALLEDFPTLEGVDDEPRQKLFALIKSVEEKIRVNALHLSVQVEVSRRIFSAFAQAAREHAPHTGIYSRSGTTNSGKLRASNGIPLSFDQTL